MMSPKPNCAVALLTAFSKSSLHQQMPRMQVRSTAEETPILLFQRTYFAGAYAGFGFHEDGFRAGVRAAARVLAAEVAA